MTSDYTATSWYQLGHQIMSMGLPAGVRPGTPSWVTDRRDAGDRFNNHNWVEVWDGKSWSFTGVNRGSL